MHPAASIAHARRLARRAVARAGAAAWGDRRAARRGAVLRPAAPRCTGLFGHFGSCPLRRLPVANHRSDRSGAKFFALFQTRWLGHSNPKDWWTSGVRFLKDFRVFPTEPCRFRFWCQKRIFQPLGRSDQLTSSRRPGPQADNQRHREVGMTLRTEAFGRVGSRFDCTIGAARLATPTLARADRLTLAASSADTCTGPR